MKTARILLAFIAITVSAMTVSAQQLWLSAEGRMNITKRLRASVELEHRSREGFDATSRWSASAGVSYKVMPWLRAAASYKFIYDRDGNKTTKKGNHIPAYWQQGHRFQVSATGSLDVWKLSLSLREAYQFTHFPGQSVAKFDSDGQQKNDEIIETENKQFLRSRLQAEFKIRKKCRFTPFASVEIYNDLVRRFDTTKIRYTAGTDIRINKHNSLTAFYRFIDRMNSRNTKVIGIGYTFKL